MTYKIEPKISKRQIAALELSEAQDWRNYVSARFSQNADWYSDLVSAENWLKRAKNQHSNTVIKERRTKIRGVVSSI